MWQSSLLFLAIATVGLQGGTAPAEDTCVRCHRAMGGELAQPVTLSEHDVHFQNGLSCHNCHGGDQTLGIEKGGPEDSMDPRKGFVGRPPHTRIASLCASCHSNPDYMRKFKPQVRVDEYSEYLTSVHGKRNQTGDTRIATCSDCHSAHGIREVSDPNSPVYATNVAATCGRCHSDPKRMEPYGIATDQEREYSESVHGIALMKKGDLSAPTCNDCHGNHGATPPGVDSVANVCGQCHVMQWNLFMQSPHRTAFADNDWPGCVTCHQNHLVKPTSDAMLGVEDSAVCILCHEQGSPGYDTAQKMKSDIVDLQTRLDTAGEILTRAERAGMEVSGPIYQLTEGHARLIRARVMVHRFQLQAMEKIIAEGREVAAAGEQSGRKALEDLAYRRKGMAISAAILLCMIGLLLLKIRQIKS
jgi:predicted CXXCH cytochrome family protein